MNGSYADMLLLLPEHRIYTFLKGLRVVLEAAVVVVVVLPVLLVVLLVSVLLVLRVRIIYQKIKSRYISR